MFRKKREKDLTPVSVSVHDDLIIHNMPSSSKFGGSMSAGSFSASFQASSSPETTEAKNFKTTGLVIMAGGLVFIGLIFYFGYIYMIKPMVDPSTPIIVLSPAVEPESIINPEDKENLDAELASTTDLTVNSVVDIEPVIVDQEIATTTEETNSFILTVAPDSDGDGLSDPEETIFGTNPLLADTDSDGYDDKLEISGGYNPSGDGYLSGAFDQYNNSVFGYELKYPTALSKQVLGEESVLILSAPDDSLIQVVAQENADHLAIMSWYNESFPGSDVSYDRLLSGNAWEGIMGTDGLNLYLTNQSHGRILIISYISANGQLSYPFIWQNIIDSLFLR